VTWSGKGRVGAQHQEPGGEAITRSAAEADSASCGGAVQGLRIRLSADDGEIYDWALSWAQWKALAVT